MKEMAFGLIGALVRKPLNKPVKKEKRKYFYLK